MKKLTKKGTERKSDAGRPQIFINDIGVTLSIKVPSKEKERFREIILALRIPYLLKK